MSGCGIFWLVLLGGWLLAGGCSASDCGRDAASDPEEADEGEHSADPLSVASTRTKSSSPAQVLSDDSATKHISVIFSSLYVQRVYGYVESCDKYIVVF